MIPSGLYERVEERFVSAGTPMPLSVVEAASPVTAVRMAAAGVRVGSDAHAGLHATRTRNMPHQYPSDRAEETKSGSFRAQGRTIRAWRCCAKRCAIVSAIAPALEDTPLLMQDAWFCSPLTWRMESPWNTLFLRRTATS